MTLHQFDPTVYHSTFGGHAPVLRVRSGDTIVTSTVDTSGCDRERRQQGPPGNPLTGPFYVEDAHPGDALAVRLDWIKPNREIGFSRAVTWIEALDPFYVGELLSSGKAAELLEGHAWVEWRIDLDSGTARCMSHTRIEDFRLPLRPVLGCIGVAPDVGQAIYTTTAGRHGGNMDYPGIVEGVTVCFPVSVEGALLQFGDGHALQGDGELLGQGLEVSMDVTVTVHVLPGKRIRWPRAENATHLIAIGNARPMERALQFATSEMVMWLQELGLYALDAHALLGHCAEYRIGNVVNEAFTVACTLPKERLAAVGVELTGLFGTALRQ